MSGQDWNTVLNRVLAVQAAEANARSAEERAKEARIALNEAINRDALENYDGELFDVAFVVGAVEFTVTIPAALRGQATVTERALNVITLNK